MTGTDLHLASHSQHRRWGAALLGALALLAVGACSGPSDEAPEPAPTTSVPAAAPTATAPPTTPALPSDALSYDLPEGLTTGDPVASVDGDYLPLWLADDAPLRRYDASIVGSLAEAHFSPEQIAAAQNVASEFVVNHGIDSVLVFDFSRENAQAWWDVNHDLFSPGQQDVFYANLTDGKQRTVVLDSNGGDMRRIDAEGEDDGHWVRGRPVYEHGTPRTGDVSIELVAVDSNNIGDYLNFEYVASASRIVRDIDGAMDQFWTEVTDYEFEILLTDVAGSWVIDGMSNTFDTTVNDG